MHMRLQLAEWITVSAGLELFRGFTGLQNSFQAHSFGCWWNASILHYLLARKTRVSHHVGLVGLLTTWQLAPVRADIREQQDRSCSVYLMMGSGHPDLPWYSVAGDCTRKWKLRGRDDWWPSERLAATRTLDSLLYFAFSLSSVPCQVFHISP